MKLIDDMTDEEVLATARETRSKVAHMLGTPVPDDALVLYEKNIMMIKVGTVWWVLTYGEETKPHKQNAITLLPFTHFLKACNDMLKVITQEEGQDAVLNLFAAAGVDVAVVVDDDTSTGEDHSPTFN